MKNYCIKNGYKSSDKSIINDRKRMELYWNNERILSNSAFQWGVYKYAFNLIREKKLKTVLDLGCGAGVKLNKIITRITSNIIGIDKEEAVEYCKSTYKLGRYYVDDFEMPSLVLSENIDLIICADVIEHLLNPDAILNYIKKYSNKKTYILFSTPERDLLRGQDCMESSKPEHIREWNSKEFKHYLENSGFHILHHKLLYPLRLTINNSILYFRILYNQKRKKLSFRYNQLVLCQKN